MSQQKAVFLTQKFGDFVLETTEIYNLGPGELLVKIHAAALNPVDWKIQKYGSFVATYPAILGTDGAGSVEEIGEGVQGFKIGDRVLFQGWFENKYATFQQYCLVPAHFAAHIPTKPIRLTYGQAASIPVALGAVSIGLYAPANGGLTPPWAEGGKGKYAGQAAVLFGGSSSVGQYALQLLKLSGFNPIITTASPKNEELVKSLGATHLIDRNAPLSSFSATVASLTSTPIKVVYDAVSDEGTQNAGYEVLSDGLLVIVLDEKVSKEKKVSGKVISHVFGNVHAPQHNEFGKDLYANVTRLVEEFGFKWNPVEELPNGLNGIVDGLKMLENNEVSGKKLAALPQYTK